MDYYSNLHSFSNRTSSVYLAFENDYWPFRKTHAITHRCVCDLCDERRQEHSCCWVLSSKCDFRFKGSRSIWMSEAEETTKPQQNRADGDDFCSCCGFWSSAWEKTKSSSRSGTISIPFLIKQSLIRMCFMWTVEKLSFHIACHLNWRQYVKIGITLQHITNTIRNQDSLMD